MDTELARRVPGIDDAVSDRWGRMSAVRSVPVVDGLLAATALVDGPMLATRNDRDVAGRGAMRLNPCKGVAVRPQAEAMQALTKFL